MYYSLIIEGWVRVVLVGLIIAIKDVVCRKNPF